MSKPKISKAGFKAYLEAHPRKRFKCRGACACPIAQYFTEVMGSTALVTRENYCLGNGGKDRKTPKWASEFIWEFDGLHPGGERTLDPVYKSGKIALEILNGL